MNRIFVLKDVAYAAKQGGGVIAGVKEVNLLDRGALAFFTPQGTLLTLANAAVEVADKKAVMVASGRELDNQLVGSVPRRLDDINLANYRAFVKPIITITIDVADAAVGDMSIRTSDISYTSKFNVRVDSGSYYKKANVLATDAVTALVDKYNTIVDGLPNFTVAAKTGATTITITPIDDGVAIGNGVYDGVDDGIGRIC
jgi:hypothetical protein